MHVDPSSRIWNGYGRKCHLRSQQIVLDENCVANRRRTIRNVVRLHFCHVRNGGMICRLIRKRISAVERRDENTAIVVREAHLIRAKGTMPVGYDLPAWNFDARHADVDLRTWHDNEVVDIRSECLDSLQADTRMIHLENLEDLLRCCPEASRIIFPNATSVHMPVGNCVTKEGIQMVARGRLTLRRKALRAQNEAEKGQKRGEKTHGELLLKVGYNERSSLLLSYFMEFVKGRKLWCAIEDSNL